MTLSGSSFQTTTMMRLSVTMETSSSFPCLAIWDEQTASQRTTLMPSQSSLEEQMAGGTDGWKIASVFTILQSGHYFTVVTADVDLNIKIKKNNPPESVTLTKTS